MCNTKGVLNGGVDVSVNVGVRTSLGEEKDAIVDLRCCSGQIGRRGNKTTSGSLNYPIGIKGSPLVIAKRLMAGSSVVWIIKRVCPKEIIVGGSSSCIESELVNVLQRNYDLVGHHKCWGLETTVLSLGSSRIGSRPFLLFLLRR